MKIFIRTALVAMVAICVPNAFGQTAPTAAGKIVPHAKTWAAEPTSIFGIKLGKALQESQLPSCDELEKDHAAPARPCTMPPTQFDDGSERGVRYIPIDLSNANNGTIYLENGEVRKLLILFKSDDFRRMQQLLEERYGAPSLVVHPNAQTRSGALFNSTICIWGGKANSITLMQHVGTIEDASLEFTNNALTAKATMREKAALRAAASKF